MYFKTKCKRINSCCVIFTCFQFFIRDLRRRQRNGQRRRFITEADWGKVSLSDGKTKFKQCSFPDRQRLFLCEEVCSPLSMYRQVQNKKIIPSLENRTHSRIGFTQSFVNRNAWGSLTNHWASNRNFVNCLSFLETKKSKLYSHF